MAGPSPSMPAPPWRPTHRDRPRTPCAAFRRRRRRHRAPARRAHGPRRSRDRGPAQPRGPDPRARLVPPAPVGRRVRTRFAWTARAARSRPSGRLARVFVDVCPCGPVTLGRWAARCAARTVGTSNGPPTFGPIRRRVVPPAGCWAATESELLSNGRSVLDSPGDRPPDPPIPLGSPRTLRAIRGCADSRHPLRPCTITASTSRGARKHRARASDPQAPGVPGRGSRVPAVRRRRVLDAARGGGAAPRCAARARGAPGPPASPLSRRGRPAP